MKTSIKGNVETAYYTTEECHARMAEIEQKLAQMGLTMDVARAHQAQYRLTETQYALVTEYDDLIWLAG
jgi:hypothetical protein